MKMEINKIRKDDKMKRYIFHGWDDGSASEIECDDGDWVKYEDVKEQLELNQQISIEADDRRSKAELEVATLKEEIQILNRRLKYAINLLLL
jgi:hypothetical protein